MEHSAMNCKCCGYRNHPNAKFCAGCGRKLYISEEVINFTMQRIRSKYMYCPKCKALIVKSFKTCPRCGKVTLDPSECDQETSSLLLQPKRLDYYEQYIWTPEKTTGKWEELVVGYDDRILEIKNGKLSFIKKSKKCICMGANRLTVDLSLDDLDRIQTQLEAIPFARWITPISQWTCGSMTGDDFTDFYYKCENRAGFRCRIRCTDSPEYLTLCKLLWKIVTSSPDYFRALDKDPAYDGAIKRTAIEIMLRKIRNRNI